MPHTQRTLSRPPGDDHPAFTDCNLYLDKYSCRLYSPPVEAIPWEAFDAIKDRIGRNR